MKRKRRKENKIRTEIRSGRSLWALAIDWSSKRNDQQSHAHYFSLYLFSCPQSFIFLFICGIEDRKDIKRKINSFLAGLISPQYLIHNYKFLVLLCFYEIVDQYLLWTGPAKKWNLISFYSLDCSSLISLKE